MGVLPWLEKHPVTRWVTLFVLTSDALALLGAILMWLNAIPRYEFKKIKADTVIPLVYLFPAQKVRLSPSFVDGTQNDRVQSANWYLKKDAVEKYTTDGLQPTIVMPGTDGGIYQLEVKVKLSDDSRERSGSTNIYVVQDTPKKVVTNSKVTVSTETAGLSVKLEKLIQEHGIEISNGSAGWIPVHYVGLSDPHIEIPMGTEMAVYAGQTVYRVMGNTKDLSNYGSFAVPNDLVNQKTPLPEPSPTD